MYTNTPFFSRAVPIECHDKLRTLADAGHRVRWVAFPPAGGNSWSVVTDKTFFNRNIPQECHDKMVGFLNAGHKIRCVAFPPGGGNSWSVVTDKAFFNRSVSPECHRVMRAMTGSGLGPLGAVAFHPTAGFVVVARADALYVAHPPLVVGRSTFSLDTFANNIRTQLQGKGCKYALMVRYGPAIRTASDGPKRTATSPPAQDFTVFDRFNPASVAKTVTAVALLQLIEQHNLTIEEPIVNHLPSTWVKGPGVASITVKELLNHTSGFRGGAKFYDDLRDMVKTGIKLADKVPNYENCNYALARIVVAYLNDNDENPADQGKATSDNFIEYVQQNIFDRLHVPAVEWTPEAVTPTLFYPTPPGNSPGTTYGDSSLKPGSSGVHVSIAELSMFVDRLAASNVLLSSGMRTQMDSHGLGWGKVSDVKIGWYHRKRGYYPAAQNGGAELNSGLWKFSTGVQAVVLHNGHPGVDMPKAYDSAWTPV
jgi:CubicO group peptidase (beta-lactamase class C family)